MKNLFLLLLLLTAAQYSFAQTKFLEANKITAKDSIVLKNKTITDVSTDTALASSSSKKITTENAVKAYVDNRKPKIATAARLGMVKVSGTKGILIDTLTGELSSSIGLLTPSSVPYVGPSGTVVEDSGGLYYNGNDLYVGHNDPSVFHGVQLNGGRAFFGANLNGVYANVGAWMT